MRGLWHPWRRERGNQSIGVWGVLLPSLPRHPLLGLTDARYWPAVRRAGSTGGIVDRSGPHGAGVAMYQTAKVMHGHDLRRLGSVRPPVLATGMAPPRVYHDESFAPPIAVHTGRDLRAAVDASPSAREAEATWGDAYYLPGSFNGTTKHVLPLADGSVSTVLAGPTSPPPLNPVGRLTIVGCLPTSTSLPSSPQGRLVPASPWGASERARSLPVPAAGQAAAPTFLTQLPPGDDAGAGGSDDAAAADSPSGNIRSPGAEASATRLQPASSAQLDASLFSPTLGLGAVSESSEVPLWSGGGGLADSLQPRADKPPPVVFSLDDIVADVSAANVTPRGPTNLVSALVTDALPHMSTRLWPSGSSISAGAAASSPARPPLPPATAAATTSRAHPLSRSTGSLRLGRERGRGELARSRPADDSQARIATHDVRDGRDDILAALRMGLPLSVLADEEPPVEVQTVRPGGRAPRPAAASAAGAGGRPITPSIPGIVNKPVTSRAAVAGDPTGRAGAALATQAARHLRVQQPEAALKLTGDGIQALHAEALDEYSYRAAYCTNYLTHYKPQMSLWALGAKARRGEVDHGAGGERDRERRAGGEPNPSSKANKMSRSVTRTYSIFDRSQFMSM